MPKIIFKIQMLKLQMQQQQPPLIPMQENTSAVTIIDAPVTIVPTASNSSNSNNNNNNLTSANNPIIPITIQQEQPSTPSPLVSIQTTNVPVQIPQTPPQFQSHEPSMNHLYSSLSADQNSIYEKNPCINPNFSKIIELSVTPSPPPIPEEPSENSNDNSAVSSPYHTNELVTMSSPTTTTTMAQQQQQQSTEPKIPISHLMATNQYPSLNRMPPANIVHSFAPVYNQSNLQSHHQQQQLHQHQQHGDELYSSYVNNPYNLTLDQNFANNQMADQTTISAAATPVAIDSVNMIQTQPNPSNLNVFQSINYFGASTDSTQIPPGSEVLFGGP